MKKITALILALCLLLTGCSAGSAKTVLTVYAAASLTEVLTEIGENYNAVSPNVELRFQFDSSGTLKTQIEEGAECDIFISAAEAQMDALESMLAEGTRMELLQNEVVLAVPDGNPAEITSFDELAQRLQDGNVLLAMGNEDVPVGSYTREILASYGLDADALGSCVTFGSNVKEVTTQVSEATVDCGVIYATDAFSANLQMVDTAKAGQCSTVIYPAAILDASEQQKAAQEFLDYLTCDEAAAVFDAVGFTPLA